MQLQIAGGTGRRIRDDRGELLSVWIGCTYAVGIVGKAGRDLRSRRVLRVGQEREEEEKGFARRFIGVGL